MMRMTKRRIAARHDGGRSIAFKPAESGWGGGGRYAANFDAVFGSARKEKGQGREGEQGEDAAGGKDERSTGDEK